MVKRTDLIKLSKPLINKEAITLVEEVLLSGNLVQGTYVQKFEELLQNYLKIKNAIVVSSGTAALHLSLLALDIGAGDEVIVPAFTFPATANVVEAVGAKPVFVDINLDDCCMNIEQVELLVNERTKAIIPVHEFGQSAEIDKIINIAKKKNIYVIEDAACALGSDFKNKKVGTFGDTGCFSFHPRKAITTGEGGAIVTNDDMLACKIRSLRNHGIKKVNNKIDFVYAGLNYRMTDFQAAIGCVQIKDIETNISVRINLANCYNEKIKKFRWIKTPVVYDHKRMVYQTYHVVVDDDCDRDGLIRYFNDYMIETNYGAQALNCLFYFKNKYSLALTDFPNATKAYLKGVALPMGEHINEDDVEYICSVLGDFNGSK